MEPDGRTDVHIGWMGGWMDERTDGTPRPEDTSVDAGRTSKSARERKRREERSI
jgi:hypothetical protein